MRSIDDAIGDCATEARSRSTSAPRRGAARSSLRSTPI
jgi:hypothetical protein